jgi:hypothetical protein
MKLQIKFKGIEPIFITTKVEMEGRSTTHTEYGLFYPIRRMARKFRIWREKRQFKKAGIIPEICDSCGENIAYFVIDNPNYGERDTWFVCECCANFCDYKMTRRPLPYEK